MSLIIIKRVSFLPNKFQGSITKTVTTTITEHHDDGSISTKTKVETFTENIPVGGSGGGGKGAKDGNTGGGSSEQAAEQMKNAERVKSTTDPKFIQEALEEHNKLRASHGIGPVSIDEDLNNVAQAWANRLLQKGKMEHSTNGFGENVFWASGGSINGAKPCQAWYSEIKDFDFNRIDHTPGTGHFTQLLWKGSDKIGIALASGKAGHFVVANYNPPGNFLGHPLESFVNTFKFKSYKSNPQESGLQTDSMYYIPTPDI